MNAPPIPIETLRLHQANERTLLAWLRTGIALMAFGFAISRFGLFLRQLATVGNLVAHAPRSLGSAWLGTLLIALGMLTSLFATLRFGRVRRSIERGDVGEPGRLLPYAIGTTVTVLGFVMAVLLAQSLDE
jgi:putative membrane protein